MRGNIVMGAYRMLVDPSVDLVATIRHMRRCGVLLGFAVCLNRSVLRFELLPLKPSYQSCSPMLREL